MENSTLTIISFILIIIGIIGTILPILPGLILSFAGLLLYKFGTTNDLSILYIWIFGLLTIISLIFEFVIPAKTNKKYGGTKWGSIGSFLGVIIGFFWIPLPFGFLIGMLLGVFFAELLHDVNDKKKALNSVKGAFIGFFISTTFNFGISLAILLIVIFNSI
jgi:hypothetical protein